MALSEIAFGWTDFFLKSFDSLTESITSLMIELDAIAAFG
jgi:hypothetical protein